MTKVEPPQVVLDCLSNEMNINTEHFLTKYHCFDSSFKDKANELLVNMLDDSKKPQEFDANKHYFEDGTEEQNEFMQAMFDCFRELSTKQGLELPQAIYEHTNRGGDNWFPVVTISSPVTDYSNEPEEMTVYRGCNINEFHKNCFRQSWSLNFEVARAFAFTHFNTDKKPRVVLEAKVQNSDIAWLRNAESEVVLLPNFKPLSVKVKLDYNQFNQSI